jgi:CheY-like chemotaxis protein
MSLLVDSEPSARIREEARALVQRIADHEKRLEALVTDAEINVRHVEAALSRCLDGSHAGLDDLHRMLITQVQRTEDSVESARQLCDDAREQHTVANRLLTHLDHDSVCDEQRDEQRTDAVLVVDDYGNVRDVLATVLQNAGFAVRTAANGLEALLAAYQMRPAVIIMDVSMPVLDGIEATRLIKASEAMRHARVIAYTGDPGSAGSRIPALFAAVLQKPATPAAVLSTVRHVAGL